jgi:hypothetical protein
MAVCHFIMHKLTFATIYDEKWADIQWAIDDSAGFC